MTKPDSDDLFSLFHQSTDDLVDQTLVLLKQEDSPHYKCRDYIRNGSSRVSAEARTKVSRWLADIVDYFSLQRQTVAAAMSYVDIFLSLRNVKAASETRRSVTKFQLVALVCLSIATKSLEVAHLDVETLVHASKGYYSAEDIREMEIIVLNALQWRLCAPTSLPIAHRAIALLTKVVPRLTSGETHHNSLTSCLVEFTRLQLELAVTDYTSSVLRKPSTVALASILNSMDLLDFDNRERGTFSRAMKDMTGLDIHSPDVVEARQELNEVFDRQSENVMSRADVSRSSRRSSYTASSSASAAVSTVASSIASISIHSRGSQIGVDEPLHTDAPPSKRKSSRGEGEKFVARRNSYLDDAGDSEIPRAVELFQGFGTSRF